MESITAESGGTRLQPMECARLVIGSVSGNHLMFLGGLEENAPYSGRGLPLYPGQQNEREVFIENANRIRLCATFSGELVYYMGYINGTPTTIDPSTQGSQPNNEPPFLVRTDPLNGQLNVPFQGSGISFVAIFNENIASGTVDTSSMSIRLSGNFVSFLSGSVDYFEPESVDDRTKIAFIAASGQLQGSSYYNVFIGQRIADDFGSTLPSTLTWSFVTAGVDDSPFFLKTNNPVSGTTLAPFSQTIEATFSKQISGTINNTGYSNNIFLWNDNIPAAGVSGVTILDQDSSGTKLVFTPIALLQPGTLYRYTISGVTDKFDQFATPVSGIAFSTGPADTAGPVISGITPAGVYPSLSGLLVKVTGVSTLINIVVEFNERLSGIPGGIISGQCVSLVNSGATSTNLSGVITLDTSGRKLTFDPVAELISGTKYQIRISGVMDVNGNIITQTDPARSGLAFETWVEADTSPPIVQSITPLSGSVGQAVNSNIVVTFNEVLSGTHPANPYTAIIGVDLSGTGAVAGTATTNAAGTVVTFDPTADLSGDRNYYVSISGALDLASNRMTPISGHVFRTIDNIAPIISGTVPLSGAVDVATNANIVITFSEAISGTANGSVTADVVRLYRSGTPGVTFAGARTLDSTRTVLTFNPTADLDQNEHYQFGVSGVRDVSGNQLVAIAANSGISFLTQGGPIITATNPVSGAIDVGLASNIVVTFNKALSGTANGTVTSPVFRLVSGTNLTLAALGGTNTLNSDKTQLTFNPTADFTSNVTYTFAISGVIDTNSNFITQTSPPRSGFTFTSVTVDTTPPTITSTVPTSGTTAVLTTTTFVMNFSEEISGTVGQPIGGSGAFRMWLSGHDIVNFPQSGVHGVMTKTATNQATFTPNASLSGNKIYRVGTSGIYDLATNVINQTTGSLRNSGFVFTTVDNIQPTILSITPASGSTNVTISQNVVITLSEPISGTVGTGTLTNASAVSCLNVAAGTLFPGTVNLDVTKTIVTFDQAGSWPSSTTFRIQVSGLQDTANNLVVPVSGHEIRTAGAILSTFYDIAGTTERRWNNVSPVLFRVGIMRAGSGSSLNAKIIKRASFKLKRTGTSNTTVFCRCIGMADEDGGDEGIIETIGSIPFNDIPTTATRVTFENLSASHALEGATNANDCIVIEWNGATGSADLTMYYDENAFEGSDTHQVQLPTGSTWDYFETRDTDAKLEG